MFRITAVTFIVCYETSRDTTTTLQQKPGGKCKPHEIKRYNREGEETHISLEKDALEKEKKKKISGKHL